MPLQKICPFLLALVLCCASAPARVVINEIFYHAPDEVEDLQFIELYNSSDQPVDLAGWAFTRGPKFKFAAGARIEPKGFLVLCRSAERFKQFYQGPTAGVFTNTLSHKEERLELSDAAGKVVDKVKYQDSAPWPAGADGYSGSLERISPDANGDDPANWASSPLSRDRLKPAGTPGKVNANYSTNLPPVVSKVTFTPENPGPNLPITVQADVRDPEGVKSVNILFRLAGPGYEKTETSIPMKRVSAKRYSADIPGQAANQLVRFRIEAIDVKGLRRVFPAETEPRPAFSSYVHDPIEPGKIPFAWIIDTTESEFKASQQRAKTAARDMFNPAQQVRFRAQFFLDAGLDVPGAWFALTGDRAADAKTIERLKPVFLVQLAERDKVIDETLESPDLAEKLNSLPEVIKNFQTALAASVIPILDPEEKKIFTAWKEQAERAFQGGGAMFFGNPGTMVKRMINLEGAWFALSVKADLDENRFADLQKNFLELVKERNALADRAPSIVQQEEGFQKLGEQAEALGGRIESTLPPLITAAQEKRLEEWRESRNMFGPPGRGRSGAAASSWRSALAYFDPATGKLDLFDFVQVAPRGGGQKVHFLKDRPLNKMTTVNIIYEGSDRFVLAEPLAYEVYRKAGMPAEQSYHVRLWLDGQPTGYFLLIEQPNRAFLRRNHLRDDGNLYKILWMERGVVRQHEKKTRTHAGHDDIVALVDALEKTKGKEQWEVIKKNFDVDQVATYFAVNMVLSHWDGFFNNYFTYHDLHGTGKWTMYPWDQDKTWGYYDGLPPGQVFYDLPLTFGMEGDAPPGQSGRANRGFGFGGGTPWWRPGGYFSKPLLANPEFRKVFLARVREIAEKVYTEENFGPLITAMGDRLRDEVKVRAEIYKEKPEGAIRRLEVNLQDLREHLKKRRSFLLVQDEIKTAGKPAAAPGAAKPRPAE